jgi:predicted transcriptional regulator
MTKSQKRRPRTIVELDPDLRQALQEHCRREGRTMTWVVAKAVRQFLIHEAAPHAPAGDGEEAGR